MVPFWAQTVCDVVHCVPPPLLCVAGWMEHSEGLLHILVVSCSWGPHRGHCHPQSCGVSRWDLGPLTAPGFYTTSTLFLTACQEAWPLRELLRLLYQHSKIWNSTHFNGISCLVLTRSFSLCSMRSLLIDRLGLGTRKGIWLLKVETEILSICFMF